MFDSMPFAKLIIDRELLGMYNGQSMAIVFAIWQERKKKKKKMKEKRIRVQRNTNQIYSNMYAGTLFSIQSSHLEITYEITRNEPPVINPICTLANIRNSIEY